MHDPIDEVPVVTAVPSLDAEARRRRIRRRVARRRLSKLGTLGMVVLAVAVVIRPGSGSFSTPDPSPDHPGTAISELAVTGNGPQIPTTGPRVAPLTVQPLWRPAGEVLKRTRSKQANKTASNAPAFAFAPDPREREQRELLGRWHHIFSFSTKYRIKPDLSRRIYDAAITAGIEPELAFRLVRVESVFDVKAVSPVGAMGLTQLMLGTARVFEPNVTREQLLDPEVNLRIGFRYLRTLIREYKGDLKLALLVYNRGPTAVNNAIAMGLSPANGYESIITRGYRGRGTLD
ncbi:MAG TPA: transglycosylase SLT domain-containing protein [Gemmatimonas sp.]|uniref:lytic transglycosylase domain-containing protein n=1 Tax=Gemmatimonas sp. TaxID=1962908 RepID=UPI002EDAB019